MSEIKLLDCTLRDGGYVNDWNFGEKNILKIINSLLSAKIDYIECGFLKDIEYDKKRSIFCDLAYFQDKTISVFKEFKGAKFALMLNFGEFDIKKIPNCKDKNTIIRLAFKKYNAAEALLFASELKSLGYEIFLNPCATNIYSKQELIELAKKANSIKPIAVAVVDTLGAIKEDKLIEMFAAIDNVLDKNIAFCFHSHDNLGLSFGNSKKIIEKCKNRDIIIDSTLSGMGRGGGNLKSEKIIKYLNENFGKKYILTPVLKTIDETIKPFYCGTSKKDEQIYRLSAINMVHPNYSKYLIEKGVKEEFAQRLFKSIPKDKKAYYDENVIKNLTLDKIK